MPPPECQLGPSRGGTLAALWYEVGLLERLLYKNKNQHRHTLHFQRLQQVHRILMIVRRSSTATAALQELVGRKSAGAAAELSTSHDLRGCIGLLRLLEQLLSAIEAASKALGALLAQSFFMPFALTVLACLARIHAIASQATESLKGRGEAGTGELGAAALQRIESTPSLARVLDLRHTSGAPTPVQPFRPEDLLFAERETLQSFAVPESSGGMPETVPPGFSIPGLHVAGIHETGLGGGVLESPPAKRLRLSEEGRGLGEATEGAMVSTEGGIAQEHEVVRSTEGGLPEETGGIPFVGNAEVLRCETRANPVGQAAAKVDESARKKRAAAWLEDLGLEARTPTRDTWQIEKASTELQRHRPLQRVVNKDEAKSGDLASNLLAGTDFEGFGELATSVGKSRGKKRMKGRKL